MGVSTDAILAFGFDLGAEEDLPDSLQELDECGIDEWFYGNGLPFTAIRHCSDSYPMFFLAVRGTEMRAKRGYPEPVSLTTPSPEGIEAMRAFCVEHAIEWQEPKWHLFSLWL